MQTDDACYREGKRGFYVCLGTNSSMTAEHLFGRDLHGLQALSSFQIFHFGYPHLLAKLQGENLAQLFDKVSATGITISLDVNGASDKPGVILPAAYRNVGILHANVGEACMIVEDEAFSNLLAKSVLVEDTVTYEELTALAQMFIQKGVGIITITLGANGAFVVSNSQSVLGRLFGGLGIPKDAVAKLSGQVIYIPGFECPPGRTLNATGAGDTFVAGLLSAITTDYESSLQSVVELAQAAAFHRIQRKSGESGILIEKLRTWRRSLSFSMPSNPHLQKALK